ncbi:MAG: tRNA (adenosine(37)-N6)-threonylcarbamoyltransferase complex transferase subunit TsaD [Parvibaculaceae bacterium]
MAAPDQTILGIETSCDETAAALVRRHSDGSGEILANVVLSQIKDHAPYGGVVPEIAARAHASHLDRLIRRALDEARLTLDGIDGVAATAGPGLIGGLLVGLTTAKALALAKGKPLLAINHLEAHALTPRLLGALDFPYLLLLISGGHTQLQIVEGVGRYRRIGTTIDDALGEAFDKTAKLLGLPYPGGPQVEALARAGNARRFDFPRPLKGREGCNFSFSGLKTAVREAVAELGALSAVDRADICASFEAAIADTMRDRVGRALRLFKAAFPEVRQPMLVVAGGVAANRKLKSTFETLAARHGFGLIVPPAHLCTDNAAMVAWAGAERLACGLADPLDAPARARWPLDPAAQRMTGAGVKA